MLFSSSAVAPLAGAWIEMYQPIVHACVLMSLPSRERGLKYERNVCADGRSIVAPLAGAWIEIVGTLVQDDLESVAPLAGAWIEIRPTRIVWYRLCRSPRGSVD